MSGFLGKLIDQHLVVAVIHKEYLNRIITKTVKLSIILTILNVRVKFDNYILIDTRYC